MNFLNKRELQQIALNHSSDINCEDFIKFLLQKRFFITKNVMLKRIPFGLMIPCLHQIIL